MKQKLNVSLIICATIVILFCNPVVESAKKVSDLTPLLTKEVSSFEGKVGIYIKDLTTGQEVNINGNTTFPTASTSKVIVAMSTYKNQNKLPADFRNSVPELISNMIIHSSNDAFAELTERLGSKYLDKTTKDMGLSQTAIHNDKAFAKTGYHSITTPREMGKALEILLSGRYLNNTDSQKLLHFMSNGAYNDEIPQLLPSSTRVAHKPGELNNNVSDVGIVFNDKRPYIISVYVQTDIGNGFASDFIANIASITNAYFSSLPPRPLSKHLKRNIPN